MGSRPPSDASTTPSEKTTIIEEEASVAAEIPVSTPVERTKSGVDDTPPITSSDSESDTRPHMETLEQSNNEDEEQAIVMNEEEETVAPAAKDPLPSPSIPEIKVKPLEVVQSNLPALRPESVPQRKPDTKEVEDAEEESSSDASEILSEKPISSEETVDTSQSTSPEVDTAAVLQRKKTDESFHRKLLKQKLEYDNLRTVRIESKKDISQDGETEVDTVLTPPAVVVSDGRTEEKDGSSLNTANPKETESVVEITGSSDSTSSIENTEDIVEEAAEAVSDDAITAVVSESIEAQDMEQEEEPAPLTATTTPSSAPEISERRVETIVALRQPKSSDEENKLAEKYAQMSLEDRAYALLCDLGMIEEHKDPNDPSYDHSKDDEYCEQRFLPLL